MKTMQRPNTNDIASSAMTPRATTTQDRQRMYRRQDREGLLYLRRRVHGLAAELQALDRPKKRSLMLPWQDVATALQEAAAAATCTNQSLKDQVAQYQMLACRLASWLRPPSVGRDTLSPSTLTWQDEHLPEDDCIRRTAMDWITQRLVHHADAAVAAFDLPYTTDEVLHVHAVEIPDTRGCIEYNASQMLLHASVGDIAAVMLFGESRRPQCTQEVNDTDAGLHYQQYPTQIGRCKFPLNMLVLHHHVSPTKFVLCRTAITDDPRHPPGAAVYRWKEWVVLEAIGATTTLVRQGSINSGVQYTATREYMPLIERVPQLEPYAHSMDDQLRGYERFRRERLSAMMERNKGATQAMLTEQGKWHA
ncbi:Aste57867_3558 [Aphanomyces stellatus]|uniref:Aste57867_3558 protein n=1 Tax=Aphanomyces stellatus TaxID=120398 RepID=A0A485KCD2_9STRA|nr:hypothetical protein As57867_003547 [Aphanomyces stellatus]VFT80721.1 Aste57867_3558 [Aphanomyces stellatus]